VDNDPHRQPFGIGEFRYRESRNPAQRNTALGQALNTGGTRRERQLHGLNDFFWRDGLGLLGRSLSTKLGARKAKRPVRRI
jgi:hypothetical protein